MRSQPTDLEIMCRLLGYLGPPISLDILLNQPEHSLIVQSYQPREMTSGVVNADGFGIGWYQPDSAKDPFTYKNILPIWSDINLPELSRYIESGCILANIRSATPGQPTDLSNCQPFKYGRLLFAHNGFISNFRQALYRPIRSQLNDTAYQLIGGSTDSEHIFGLLIHHLLTANPQDEDAIAKGMFDCFEEYMVDAMHSTLMTLTELANSYGVRFSANVIISNGQQLIASRYCIGSVPPTLYWLRNDPNFPDSVIIASEPLFPGDWQSFPEQSILNVKQNLEINFHQI